MDNFRDYESFRLVSSDCQPLQSGAVLCICRDCSIVQKAVNDTWQKSVNEVYLNYNVYAQSEGKEQRAFNSAKGESSSRSSRILNWLQKESGQHALNEEGSLLDFGCGNGSFLREFNRFYPGWRLTGLEIDDSNKKRIERIPNTTHRTGAIESVPESYDMVSMIHVLEHLVDPIRFLIQLQQKLKPGAMLLIEVPNLMTSPFDLFILDHCTHFTLDSLRWVLWKSGFKIIEASTDVVAKEITVISMARDEAIDSQEVSPAQPNDSVRAVGIHLDLAKRLRTKGNELEAARPAIFGSSISGTWLANEISFNISAFIDEDADRVGNFHCGIPIRSLNEMPSSLPVLLPFSDSVAESISVRLGKTHSLVLTYSAGSDQ